LLHASSFSSGFAPEFAPAPEFVRAGQAKARELGVKGVLAIFKQKKSGT